MKINVVCDYFGTSGYAIHSKNLINALHNEGLDIIITCNKPDNWMTLVNDNELKMMKGEGKNCDYVLLITLPHSAPYYISEGVPIIQYVVWEGDKIPKGWVDILNNDNIKHILVPSNHTKEAIIKTLQDDSTFPDFDIHHKIHIIPHGLTEGEFYPKPELKNKEFTFLSDKGWPNGTRDRGGLSFLSKAFAEEFNAEEDVKLLVKINGAYGVSSQLIDNNIKELDIQNKTPGKIDFIVDNVNTNVLNDIYNKAHVYVIPSLAESFHIGGLQAQACGIPIITNDFGGQLDYINNENGWVLKEGTFREIDWDSMYEGISWKLPSVKELREKLRHVYNNREEVIIKGKKSLEYVKKFTWSKSAKLIKELISSK